MEIPYFQIDAFTSNLFGGNPAGVCLLEQWPTDETMQAIGAENNLSETAFLVPSGPGQYDLRWFTPEIEVDLCGHATLASAFVIFRYVDKELAAVSFNTKSGLLSVVKDGDRLTMDFPSRPPSPCPPPEDLIKGLEVTPLEVHRSRDFLALLESEDQVRQLRPDFQSLARLDATGIIVTAKGQSSDFVSRFFAPAVGIPEDPVTGSAHCSLIPYWAGRLGKSELHAFQVSRRGGELFCRDAGDRVHISGRAVTYLQGTINI